MLRPNQSISSHLLVGPLPKFPGLETWLGQCGTLRVALLFATVKSPLHWCRNLGEDPSTNPEQSAELPQESSPLDALGILFLCPPWDHPQLMEQKVAAAAPIFCQVPESWSKGSGRAIPGVEWVPMSWLGQAEPAGASDGAGRGWGAD